MIGYLHMSANLKGNIVLPEGTIPPEEYKGPYTVTPNTKKDVTLNTSYKLLTDNVKVLKIPRQETSNPYGTTIYIGGN